MHKHNRPSRSIHAPSALPPSPAERVGFARWLQKLVQMDGAARREVEEEARLESLKRLMIGVLDPFLFHMCRRDMQLYLRVLAAEQSNAVRQLRFEYFDLLCRMLSEGEAMEHLLHVDALLDR
jgi:hypothetical protein